METLQQQPVHNSPMDSRHDNPVSEFTCARCEGLLVESFCISPLEGNADFQIRVKKCLQCGDLFDRTILENRRRSYFNHPNHN